MWFTLAKYPKIIIVAKSYPPLPPNKILNEINVYFLVKIDDLLYVTIYVVCVDRHGFLKL